MNLSAHMLKPTAKHILKAKMSNKIQATLPSEAEMRQAIRERDRRYDDVFLYGVITTGVFCLPSCAVRPARPENIRFYFDARSATTGGLRPCKRCRPIENATQRAALIQLARYIETHAAERLTLQNLAQQVNMSPTRLQKCFKAQFGVSPKTYQDSHRLQGFKTALNSGQDVTAAIYEAGFGSTSRIYGMANRNIGMTPKSYRAGGRGETIYYAQRRTALGELMMAATDKGVCFAQFGDSTVTLLSQLRDEFPQATVRASVAQDSKELDMWIAGLDDHLSHNAPRPDLPLDMRGTAFQIQVWRYLCSVLEGDVVSYTEVAQGIAQPRAARPTASACGANKIAVLIPCHRVLRGDGNIGGYRWGIDRKRSLLAMERERRTST